VSERRVTPPPAPLDRRAALVGGALLAVFAAVAIGLLVLALGGRDPALGDSAAASPLEGGRLAPRAAPDLDLLDQRGEPFALTSLEGRPVLVFFGYTHCPDVCPATVGVLNQVLADAGPDVRAVFVSIDPDRDGPTEMASYLRYLPAAYTGLSGTPEAIARTASAWGVKYAKVDEGTGDAYGMAHTADVFLVDAAGNVRGQFPFGTEAGQIAAEVRALIAQQAAGPSAVASAPAATPGELAGGSGPGDDLRVLVVSSSIWAGPETPVIVTLTEPDGTPLDGSQAVAARVIGANETPTAPDVTAVAIQPAGAKRASFVATVQVPVAGWWRLDLVTADGRKGSVAIEARDPGASTAIGAPAPAIDTPTLDDVGGRALAITTQEAPDLRLYRQSTADARAAGRPYVLVVDSARFKVSPACGRAITMVGYLVDRWADEVAFIHLEPFRYEVVTEAPILAGELADPPLNDQTAALGLGDAVWPATRMPWIFVVDGEGIVRAKYEGIVGSADIDLILSLIAGRGVAS
jgi:cytochrome oxidase Cu insertion factor (SCO1/SenC/PrrC family)